MQTGVGQRFEGQIDAQNVLKGEVIGACVHDAMQRKSAYLEQRRSGATPPSPSQKGSVTPSHL
jgi:hypothetical protein